MATSHFLQRIGRFNPKQLNISRKFATTVTTQQQNKLTTIDVDAKTAIATLTFNRPPANALSHEMLLQIKQSIQELEKSKCRGIVITSSSNRIFSAGLDLNEAYGADPQHLVKFWRALQDAWHAIFSTALPTAALINGHALAGGCMLALSCDYRVMLPNFIIGLNETKAGIAVPKWVINTYLNVLPSRRRAEADLIEGKIYNCNEALQVGVIDDLVETKEQAREKCSKFFEGYDERVQAAMAKTKLQFREDILKDFEKIRDQDVEAFVSNIQRKEVQEFLGNYLESLKSKKKK